MSALRTLPVILALFVTGCSDNTVELPNAGGTVERGLKFRLPGPIYRLESSRNPASSTRTDHAFKKATWEAEGWTLWVAANVYSAMDRPREAKNWDSPWKKARSAKDRAIQDGNFLAGVKEFARLNDLPLLINYLGYDDVPASLVAGWESSRGLFYSWSGTECEFAFNRCVDNYFLSPVDRLSGGDRLAFKDWVKPFFHFDNSQIAIAAKDSFEAKGGSGDENSEFYDWWPTMVFLVNPDGEVVRAWMPQTGNTARIGRVVSGITEEMEVNNPIVVQERFLNQPSVYAYYGDYYIEKGVKRLVDTLDRISEE